jgi:putative flippase GtrA
VLIANAIAWVLAVAFAFITNKLYVFRSKSFEPSLLRRELISFVGARLLTLGIDELGMMLLVSVMGMNDWIAKTIVNVLVIVLNYILSKLFIFKKES